MLIICVLTICYLVAFKLVMGACAPTHVPHQAATISYTLICNQHILVVDFYLLAVSCNHLYRIVANT